MVRKIIDKNEFNSIVDEGFEKFGCLEESGAHQFLRHDKDSIKNNFSNSSILRNYLHVWVSFSNKEMQAIGIFHAEYNPKFDENILYEFFWASCNPKHSLLVINEAEKWCFKNKYKYIVMNLCEKMPKKNSLRSLYKRRGFLKDSESFIKRIKHQSEWG